MRSVHRHRRTRAALAAVTFLSAAFIFPPAVAGASAPLFSDGFEAGDLSQWTDSSAFSAQQQVVFSGSWSGRAVNTGPGAYVSKSLAPPLSSVYFDTRFNIVSANGTFALLRYRETGGSGIIALQVNGSNKLSVKNVVTGMSKTSATSVTENVWHEIQLHVTISGATSLIEVWLDGTQVTDLGGTDNLGTTAVGRVQLGSNNSTPKYDVAFDDAAADTSFIGNSPPPPPLAPTNLHTTSVTSNEVDLAWDASTGATTYTVYRDGAQIGTSATTSFQDTTAQPLTNYSYTVDAVDASNQHSPQSAPLPVSTPAAPLAAPTNLHTTLIASNEVDLAWDASTGATTYTVYRDGAQIGTSATTSFQDTTAQPLTNYSYTVDAVDASNQHSPQSAPLPVSTPGGPTRCSYEPAHHLGHLQRGGPRLGCLNRGHDHTVYRDSAQIGTSATTSFQDTTAQPSTNYSYTVDAVDASNQHSPQSAPALASTPAASPLAPANLHTTSVTSNEVDLAWDASTGATTYTVYRDSAQIGTSATTSFQDTTAQPSTNYSYTVDAVDASNQHSPQSAPVPVSTPAAPLAAPTNLHTTSVTSNEVDLAWDASTGATTYTVYRDGAQIGTSATTSFQDTTAQPLTNYSYTVDAVDASNQHSPQSAPLPVSTPAAPPRLFSDGFETGNLSDWTASSAFSAQQQLVFTGAWGGRATSTGPGAFVYKSLAPPLSNVYFDTRFNIVSANGTFGVIRFREAGGSGIIALQVNGSNKLSVKNLVTGTTRTSARIVTKNVWHEAELHVTISGASSLVEVWLDGAQVTDVGGTDNLGTTAVGRVQLGSNSTAPTYDVAFDDAVADTSFIGNSPPPPPLAPTNLHTTLIASNEVDLAWDASTGATTYTVYRDSAQIGTSATTSFQDTTAQPSTNYSYTVDAVDASNQHSPQSAPLPVSTPAPLDPGDPVIAAAGDICGDVNLTCQASSDLIISRTDVDKVLSLGDNVYPCASMAEFTNAFDPYWGRFKSMILPTVGNHEYQVGEPGCDTQAASYFSYFGAAAQPNGTLGYYYYDIAGTGTSQAHWRIIVLNGNCGVAKSGGCAAGSPQEQFLQSAINSTPSGSCIAAAWHQPLFSGSPPSPNTVYIPFWNDLIAAHAALVLNGHKHYYQRFVPQDSSGVATSDGLTEIIAGTGGATLGSINLVQQNSAMSDDTHFGVLFLTLRAGSFNWQFVTTAGATLDSGTASCTPRP